MLRRNKLIIIKRKDNGRPKYSTAKFIKLENYVYQVLVWKMIKFFKIYYKNGEYINLEQNIWMYLLGFIVL